MNLMRLFVVFLVVTLGFGAFGAAVGGLFGVGASGPVGVYGGGYEVQKADEGTDESVRGVEVGVGRPNGETSAGRGAAIGGGFGLIVGSVLGFLIALADQAVHLVRTGVRRHGGDPSETT